jgi:hypothetical protein
MFGAGPQLGLGPAPEYTLCFVTIPVGPYYPEGRCWGMLTSARTWSRHHFGEEHRFASPFCFCLFAAIAALVAMHLQSYIPDGFMN